MCLSALSPTTMTLLLPAEVFPIAPLIKPCRHWPRCAKRYVREGPSSKKKQSRQHSVSLNTQLLLRLVRAGQQWWLIPQAHSCNILVCRLARTIPKRRHTRKAVIQSSTWRSSKMHCRSHQSLQITRSYKNRLRKGS